MRPSLAAAAAVAVAVVLSACSGASDPTDDDTLTIVATTTILGDLVIDLVGDLGDVEVLMAPGQDPHGFAVSARQTQSVQRADLVVANGLGLEPALDDLLAAAEGSGVHVLNVAEGLDPLPLDGGDAHESDGDHDDHDHGNLDPHVWLDPVRMAAGVHLIAGALSEVAPDVGDWDAAGNRVADAVLATHDEVAAILATVPADCRRLVTNHDSLGYLAARYDFEVIATVLPGSTSQAEPSAGDFAALIDLVRTSGVTAIFAETTESGALAQTLAQETGTAIEVVTLHTGSLGEPGSGAETYAGLLVTDASLIADALATC